MSFYTGSGVTLALNKEDNFAEGVEPRIALDLTSESIKTEVEKGNEGTLIASKTAHSRDLLGVNVSGSVSFVLRPDSAPLLMLLSFGGDHVSEETDWVYTHTFTLASPSVSLPSFSTVIDRKASIKCYPGCTISSLTLDAAAGDYVKGSIELKGTKEERGTLPPTIKVGQVPSYRCTSAHFKVGGEVFDISSSSFKLDNALEDAPRTYHSGLYMGQPQHAERVVTLSFETPYTERVESFKSSYLETEETASVELMFTSRDTENERFTILIPHLAITNVDNSVSGTGALTASIEGEALTIGNDEPVTVIIKTRTQNI